MEKCKLLTIPLLVGLILMLYSWYSSFPLSVNSIGDSPFYHTSILYWFSIPLLLTSMFLIAMTSKNQYLKWAMSVAFVIVLYSIYYLFNTMETSDAAWFRGLTQNFITTNNLDSSQFSHAYYQYPSFFLLASITTLVSGIKLTIYEFLLFTIIGFLLSTALFVYASKLFQRNGFLAVASFFIVMFFFFNYQAVPFSLAFAILLIIFMLETQKRRASITVTEIILYAVMVITHSFVPLFFVIYLLVRSIVNRSRQYFENFIITLVIFLVAQITFAIFSFQNYIKGVFFAGANEYSGVIGNTFSTAFVSIDDAIPQIFSRTVTIGFGVLCVAGFFFLIFKKKLRRIDISILLTGIIYSGVGIGLSVLGSRAIALVFIPISLGIACFFETKFRKYLKYAVIVLLILVVFVPIHMSLSSNLITFQTKEDLSASNFMIEKYDWNTKSTVIITSPSVFYINPQVQGKAEIDADLGPRFGLSHVIMYDSILYSVDFARRLSMSNISIDLTSEKIIESFDILYNSGDFFIAQKST
jgi:hypothetical protein